MFSTAILLVGLLALFKQGDATPAFTSTATATINEIAAVATTVQTLTATPASGVTFVLTSQTPTSSPLKYEIATADVKVLNQASAGTYTLLITATDSADSNTATQSLVVTVAANVAPVFTTASPTSLTVADASAAATSVGTVTATDANSDTITYAITAAGNTNLDFSIASSGQISVATGKTLARATTPKYTLSVTASDSVLSAVSTVCVCVGTTAECTGVTCGNSAGIITAGMMTAVGVLVAMLRNIS